MPKFSEIHREYLTLAQKFPQFDFNTDKSGKYFLAKNTELFFKRAAVYIPAGYGYGYHLTHFFLEVNNTNKKIIANLVKTDSPFKAPKTAGKTATTWGIFFLRKLKDTAIDLNLEIFNKNNFNITLVIEELLAFAKAISENENKYLKLLTNHYAARNRRELLIEDLRQEEEAFKNKNFLYSIPVFQKPATIN